MELEHRDITEQIIGASFEVFRELGYGFLERVYQQAMKVELELRGLKAEIEADIQVQYKNHVVGNYRACLLYRSPSPRDRTRSRMPSSA